MLLQIALLAATFGLSTAESTLDRRIYYGEVAGRNEFPSMVSLQTNGETGCGGVLLSGDRVLTAAHCEELFEGGNVTVYGGSNDLTTGGKHVKVSKVVNHPDYDGDNHDIAVWHLKSSFCGRRFGFAQLPEQGYDPVHGDIVTVAGWGLTEDETEEGRNPHKLRKATIPVVGRKACNERYKKERQENWNMPDPQDEITNDMICIGVDSEIYRGTCSGDSGGPAFLGSQVVGVTSWGLGCRNGRTPAVNTRVGNYVEWIKKSM